MKDFWKGIIWATVAYSLVDILLTPTKGTQGTVALSPCGHPAPCNACVGG